MKDTVHKHSLLHHVCNMVIDQFPETSDLYSDIGPIARASRTDWEELGERLRRMEKDCKLSWDYLRAIAKHDTNSQIKNK